jgi:hyperosmotically inducible periplasmic protein
MSRILLLAAVCVLIGWGVGDAVGQQKESDSIGEKVNRGLHRAEEKLRETWGDIQRATHRMTVRGRVYARLYWDKQLADAPLQIETKDKGVVVLKGTVPTSEAKRHAVELANSTVGVNETIDELGVAPNKVK